MLKNIIKKSISKYPVTEGIKFYVILDNSPGFTSISREVEEWLTDIGPKRGKFLFISSMDKQDMVACIDGIKGVHKRFKYKWNVSRKLNDSIQDKNENICLNKWEKSFFQRLIDVSEDIKEDCNDYELPFYTSRSTSSGEEFLTNASRFCSLIVNKDMTEELLRINPDFLYDSKFIFEEFGMSVDEENVPYSSIPSVLSKTIQKTSETLSEFKTILENLPSNLTIKYNRNLAFQYQSDTVFISPLLANDINLEIQYHNEIEESKIQLNNICEGFVNKYTGTNKQFRNFIGSVYDALEFHDKKLGNIRQDKYVSSQKMDTFFVDSFYISWLKSLRAVLYRVCNDIFNDNSFSDPDNIVISKEKVIGRSIDFGRYIIRNISHSDNDIYIDTEAAAIHATKVSNKIDSVKAKQISKFVSPYLCFIFALAGAPVSTNPLLKALTVFEIIYYCSLRKGMLIAESGLDGMSWKAFSRDENELDSVITYILSKPEFMDYITNIHVTRGHLKELHKEIHEAWTRVFDIRADFSFLLDCIEIVNKKYISSRNDILGIRDLALSVIVDKSRGHSWGIERLSIVSGHESPQSPNAPHGIRIERNDVDGFLEAFNSIFGSDEWSTE